MLKKVLTMLNIRADHNQKWLLICMAVSGVLITYTYPVLLKSIISALPSEWLAFQSLVASVSSLLVGIVWKGNVRRQAIRRFAILAIIESLCGFFVGMYLCFVEFNPWVYAIASLIYVSFISIFVGKCIMFFKSRLWIEKERETYDNNLSIVSGIVCIVGYFVAIIAAPSLKLALFLWGACCIIDDIGWIYIYLKNKENLVQNIDDEKENKE